MKKMTEPKTYNPYLTFKKVSDEWEKQINESIHRWTNNREFVELVKWGTMLQQPYLKMFKKNQEYFAKFYNIPTKYDVAKAAKLTVQTEEKVDLLEEQLWKLEEKLDQTNHNVSIIAEAARDMMKLTKVLKTDQKKLDEIHSGLNDVTRELAEIYSLKEELAELKEFMKEKSEQEQVLELTAATK
jgi:polyhydroxyalkanoic acid synthase PhaR subunit